MAGEGTMSCLLGPSACLTWEVQGSGSHPAIAGPHCPPYCSQAVECGTPDLQPNPLQLHLASPRGFFSPP